MAELVAGREGLQSSTEMRPELSAEALGIAGVVDWIKHRKTRLALREKITREVLDLLANNPALGDDPKAKRKVQPTGKHSLPVVAKRPTA